MHTQEFSSDWPGVLDDILEFIVLTQLSLGRGRPVLVKLSLSRVRVTPEQLQPHVERFRAKLVRQVPQLRLVLGAGPQPAHRVEVHYAN